MKFEGIYTPAITPFDRDGNIDKPAFEAVLEWLVDQGVNGIVIGGTTGEYYAQTPEERIALTAWAKAVINDRARLVIGTGAIRTEDSIEYAKAARTHGADAILIGSPPYALPTTSENVVHALRIDEAAGLPVMLYNYPGRMTTFMGRDFLQAVTNASPRFMAIKESSGETGQLHLLATEFPRVQISCGWDDQALEFFAWGANSWTCAGSNFLPKEHIALYEACVLEKDFDKGRRIMSALMPLMDFLEQGKFVQSIKFGCESVGIRAGMVRAPLQGLGASDKDRLGSIIETVRLTIKGIVQEGRP